MEICLHARFFILFMSKSQLKKELSNLEKEQLIEVILEMYDKRKDAKEYFNFYLNPDSKMLREKYEKKIFSEIKRSKYGRSKARITAIRRYLAEFESFSPDTDEIFKLHLNTIANLLYHERLLKYSATLVTGTKELVLKYIDLGIKEDRLERRLKEIDELIGNEKICRSFMHDLICVDIENKLKEENRLSGDRQSR